MFHRREVVARLLEHRADDLLVVTGLGSPTWDVASTGNHPQNFNFIGAMGQAVPFALGLAIARPDKQVLAITGDGELLMGLGVLATIGNVQPRNLSIVVLDNEAYAETGGQATATRGFTDLAAVALGCGFPSARAFSQPDEQDAITAYLGLERRPSLAVVKVELERLPMKFPYSFDGVTAINRFRDAIDTA